jgi:hypothetical protein
LVDSISNPAKLSEPAKDWFTPPRSRYDLEVLKKQHRGIPVGCMAKNSMFVRGKDPAIVANNIIISSHHIERIESGGIIHGNQTVIH